MDAQRPIRPETRPEFRYEIQIKVSASVMARLREALGIAGNNPKNDISVLSSLISPELSTHMSAGEDIVTKYDPRCGLLTVRGSYIPSQVIDIIQNAANNGKIEDVNYRAPSHQTAGYKPSRELVAAL